METPQTLVEDFPGFGKVFVDGSLSRYDQPVTAASEKVPLEGSRSKDIVIDPATGVWARLFLPDHVPGHAHKLPLLFYFHGGGFCFLSAASENLHFFLSGLASRAQVLVISVNYRLAPEHRFPTAYDDGCRAVEWFAVGAGKADPWLESYADYSRCFMGGESAGGNMIHFVASRTVGRDLGPLKMKGLVAIMPYFGSEERIEREKAASEVNELGMEFYDMCWRLFLPPGSDRDHPAVNPRGPRSPDLRDVLLPPVLVAVASLDLLKAHGVLYYELLQNCGKEAELTEAVGEGHAYHFFNPRSEAARLLQDRISQFIHRFDV